MEKNKKIAYVLSKDKNKGIIIFDYTIQKNKNNYTVCYSSKNSITIKQNDFFLQFLNADFKNKETLNKTFFDFFSKTDLDKLKQIQSEIRIKDCETSFDDYLLNLKKYFDKDIIIFLNSKISREGENLKEYKGVDIYFVNSIMGLLYVIIKEFDLLKKMPIKQCKYCGRYFIPTVRKNELYCDLPREDGRICRELGAKQTRKEKIEKSPALSLYSKIYQRKAMQIHRSNNDKELKEKFEQWKKEVQSKIKLFKRGELDENTLYNWIIKNK